MKIKRHFENRIITTSLALLLLASCGSDDNVDPADLPLPDILASNAFYYYSDVDAAWTFYTETLGFETVVDYGFAKILRVADSSYLTLVNAADGMHSVDEPKTVTLTLITDDIAGWHEYFGSNGIVTQVSFDPRRDARPASFAIKDTEGYVLRFQDAEFRAGDATTVRAAGDAAPLRAKTGRLPDSLNVRATLYALYMQDIAKTLPFYRNMFGMDPVIDNDWAAIFQVADSSYVGLVKGGDDLHTPTEQNGVTLSFFTSDVDAWFDRAKNIPGFELRTDEIIDESGMVRVFVGYDPEGYFLEWDTFGERPDNMTLLRYLNR